MEAVYVDAASGAVVAADVFRDPSVKWVVMPGAAPALFRGYGCGSVLPDFGPPVMKVKG